MLPVNKPQPKLKDCRECARALYIYHQAKKLECGVGVESGGCGGWSCISLLGKNSAVNPAREMPIVAGTGLFRLASGYAIAQTYRLDVTTGDAIVGHQYTSTD
ncbi:hypothetical protein POTOM_016023 [Populus tomentosa]|uniref:Dirigent protein n=1 Tax=Populus tomentosa TaxID=118781 RepID=A0A8X8D6H6_POPTO|nr:hypothetical protein POTOM_016023 [Populus tomentosa]